MKPVRVLLVGWDGAEPELLEPWAAQGRLPVLASLLARGAGGRLASTVPAQTPPAWTSLVTGVDPGRHGIYSFTSPTTEDYTEHFVNATERQAPSVWQYMSAAGRRVGVFNLSFSCSYLAVINSPIATTAGLVKRAAAILIVCRSRI